MKKKSLSTDKKVVTFGEVMLRLTTPGFRRFSQTNEFVATYGGSEANVAVSLAHFGIPTEFVTRLPDNAVSRACIASLRAGGLGTDGIVFGGKRLGLYYLECGAAFRNSNVVYDREGSSFATLRPGMIDWETIFADAGWFHWSGIAAALSQEGADACREALEIADRMGLTISCDLNFRRKLWSYGRTASEVMQPLVQYSDVISVPSRNIRRFSAYSPSVLKPLMPAILLLYPIYLLSRSSGRLCPGLFRAAERYFWSYVILSRPIIICLLPFFILTAL